MNRRGLTLMELVVALTVGGLALSMGYAAFSSIVDSQDRADEVSAATGEASAIRQTLLSWLEGARLTVEQGGPRFRGLDGVHEGLDDDELWFLTTSRTPIGETQTIVRLFVDRDDETPLTGLVASLAEWRGMNSVQIEVEPHVTGLEIRYLSSALGARRWLPSWISSTVLPSALELRLSGASADSLHPVLEWPILVTLRGGV